MYAFCTNINHIIGISVIFIFSFSYNLCITTYTKYTQLLFKIITKTDLFYQANKDITYLLKIKLCLKQINFILFGFCKISLQLTTAINKNLLRRNYCSYYHFIGILWYFVTLFRLAFCESLKQSYYRYVYVVQRVFALSVIFRFVNKIRQVNMSYWRGTVVVVFEKQ